MGRKEPIKKEIDLSELPMKNGIGANMHKMTIDFTNCIGYKVKFLYDDNEFDILSSKFKECKIGAILKKNTSEFKIEVETHFKDKNRDMTIIDRKKIQNKNGQWMKYYKYKCNLCGFDCGKHYRNSEYVEEYWIEESNLLHHKKGCACCCTSPKIVVAGINDIPTTAPWMIPYFQGGYDEAKKYTAQSNLKIQPVCIDCVRVKNNFINIYTLYTCHSINCNCSDKIPYGEKIVFSVLEQLGINFRNQLSKTTFRWCDKYRYDFCFEFNNEQIIIEVNGNQHYEESFGKFKSSRSARTLKEEQLNDKLKKELAIENGIKEENYIIIDCRKSTLDWIKEHILESNLAKLFDLSHVNWLMVEEFAYSNLVKLVCEYKRDNPNITASKIGKIMKLSDTTIRTYLKKGSKIWDWCNYNSKEEQTKASKKSGKMNGKQVEIFKKEISLGIFESTRELERQSEKLFEVQLLNGCIARVCRGERKHYKGYIFKYIEEKELNKAI